MPDFDKNLQPIMKDAKLPLEDVLVKAPTPYAPMSAGSSGVRDLSHEPGPFDKLKALSQSSNFNQKGIFVTDATLEANKRYKVFNPTIGDYEDFAAYGQSNWDKAANGVLKGLNLVATTVAGTGAMLVGGTKSIFSGRLADIWDNELSRGLDEWNNKVDNEFLPNYYTAAEKNADWYSPTNWFKTNFLFDKLIKNAGFAVGAMVTGNIANAGLLKLGSAIGKTAMAGATAAEASQAFRLFTPLLRNTARAFSAGKNLEVAGILEGGLSDIADLTAKSSKIAELSKLTNSFANFGNVGRRSLVAGFSSAGEASFESIQTGNEFKKSLIEEYKATHNGEEPTGRDLEIINSRTESVGATSFFGNMALLSITEYVQLPKLLGSNYSASKQAANSLMGAADDVVLKGGKYAAKEATTKFGKLYGNVIGASKYIFDPKEALQEGLQYTLQVGTQNYFKKAGESKDASAWVDGVLYGFTGRDKSGKGVGTLVSKEGMESIALGGITGGMMQIKGNIQEAKALKAGTQNFINELDPAPTFKEAFKERLAGANRGIVLQQQQQAAVIQGDKLEAKDLDADMMHNYIAPRIKYGRFDMVMDDIEDLKREGSTEQGLAALKQQGLANVNDTVSSYQQRLSKFETVAKNTQEIYKATDLRFSGEILKDDKGEAILTPDGKQQRKYSPQVIDKMVYAASKIADYDLRIPQVNLSLSEAGIMTSDILESIIEDSKPNKEATTKALNDINDLNVLSSEKDELKTSLSDVIELALRRKKFMGEYDDIKSNPTRYESAQEFEFGETKEVPVTVAQDSEEKPTKRLQIGKEYSLAEPFRIEGAQLQLAPKITVLSQTLGGELEVRLPNGKTSFMTPEEFEKYTISDKNNTSQEIADILDKAIDTVLKNGKHDEINAELKEVVKQLGEKKLDKLGWVNSLENQDLIDDIEEEFNRVTKEVFEKRNKQAKEAEQLKRNKEEITKQQGEIVNNSGTVGTNNPNKDNVAPEGKIPPASILFISGTSMSEAEGYYIDENGEVLDSEQTAIHIRNQIEFLNNVGGMDNRKNMRAILITPALAKAYGLDGLVELSYNKPLSEIPDVESVDDGFIAQVFVEQVGDKLFFVDKNGNQIGEVGVQVENLSDVIFQTMRTTKTEYRDGTPRYRKDQKAEAEAYAAAWKIQRAKIFNIDPNESPTPFAFQVSRGIAKMGDVDNHISGVLIDEKTEAQTLATDQTLIQIPTAGVVAHHTGQINVPNGRPMLVHNDNVEFLNNRRFTKKQAEGIYEVIKQIATEITEQSNAGKRIIINKKLSRFLQNVLYWRLGKTEAESNQINISEDGSSISLSGNTYSIPEIAERKDDIIEALEKAFHNVNNNSLAPENFSKPFTEYYMKDGELVSNEWTNYQTYLLSSKYPNGSSRSVEDTPLSTKITKPTDAVPTTHEQKYSTLVGLELPVGVIAKPAPAAAAPTAPSTQATQKYDYDGETDNIAPTPFGDVIFTVNGNEEPIIDETSNVVIETRDKIIAKIKSKEGNESLTNEELIPQAMNFVRAYVNKELEADRALAPKTPVVVAQPVAPAAPITELERLIQEGARLANIRSNDKVVRKAIIDFNNKKITIEELDAAFKKWDDENGLTAIDEAIDAERKKQAGPVVTDNLGFQNLGNIGNQGLAVMEADILKKGRHVISGISKATPEQRKKIDTDIEQLKKKYPEKTFVVQTLGDKLTIDVVTAPVSTDAKADIERRKRLANAVIDYVWDRLAKQGITNADPIIGTRDTIENVDSDKFWSNVIPQDLQRLKDFYVQEKQKQLESYKKYKGEFDPTSGTFTSDDTSFYDNKIKDVDAELATLEGGTSTQTEAPTVNIEAEKKKLEAERDRKIEEEAPVKRMNYMLGMQFGVGEYTDIGSIADLSENDSQRALEALEKNALTLAKFGVQPILYGKQSAEAIKNIRNTSESEYNGNLKDGDENKLLNKSFSIRSFFLGLRPAGITLGSGVRFNGDLSKEDEAKTTEVKNKLAPDQSFPGPELAYVQAIRWAQMKLAGQTTRSLGEFLLDTQKEIRDEYQAKIDALEGKSVTPTVSTSAVEEQRAEAIAKIYSFYNQAYQMQKELAERGRELDRDYEPNYVDVLKDPIAYLQKQISNFKTSIESAKKRLEDSKSSREELVGKKDKMNAYDFEKELKKIDDSIKSDEIFINDYTKAVAENEQLIKDINALEGSQAAAPKEPGSFNPNNIGKRDDVGFRKVGKDRTDRMTEADLKAFKEWHAKYVPFIPFEVLENMINLHNGEKAWGVFENGVAKFVKGGLRGTEYHEVGEAIWNGMLTKEERQALIAEFRNKTGQFTDRETGKKYNHDDPTISDDMVKERILDDFADFRVGKLPARTLGEKITNFFRRIFDFVKSFIAKPSLKTELFKAIESGKFKDRQLSTESKSMPPQYRGAGHLTEEETNAYVKDMTAIASNIIFGSGKMGTIDKTALYNLRTLTSDDIFSMIEEFYTKQGVRQELGDIAWKDLVVKTKQELKTLLKVDFNEEDLVNINEGETNKNDYAREPFSTDWKKNAPMGIKFATATLLDRVPTNQEDSNSFSLPKPKVNKKYQTFSLLPYTRAFVTMLDAFKNTTSIGKLVSKVVKLGNEDANYVSMFQRLGGNMENKTINFKDFKFEDWRFFIEFMQTYTKQKPNAVIQYISQGQVYSGSALVTGIVNKTVNSWVSNLKGLSKEEDSVIKWDSVDKSYSVTDLSGIPSGTPEEKEKFLAKLGIIFPLEAWAKLKEPQQKEFTIAVASIKEYLQKAKQIKSIQKNTLDVAGHYDTLATLLVNVTHPNQETTRINIDGKQSNSFADNNVPSVFENEFNEAKTLDELLTIRPELKDLYSRGALLLKKGGQFFDKDGNRTSLELKVGYIEGTKNKDNNKGTSSTALNLGDRFTQEINQNLNGQYYIMVPADGSTEWMMNMGNHVAFEDIEQGKDGWKKINEIFRGYLTDDVALALDADNREQLRNVGKKGKDLRFFKDILSEKTLTKINQMIEENATQQDIESFIDDNIEDVNASIKEYIEAKVEKTIDILMQNGQVKFVTKDATTGIDYYRYDMLNSTFAINEKLNKNKLTKDDLTNIITFANSNYEINNIEFHKIIFGDPYQFAIKEGILDATKRYKSFFSPRRTTIDSPELNTFINEDLNNAGGIQLLPGEPGYHQAKAWMDTVTVNDVTIVGSVANMKNVPEDIRKAYAKTNEGDASSIMMDGTYRELKIKNGQWNINGVEEAWHQWQMAYTRQNLPGFKYSDDARGKALEKHDIALLKTKQPDHKIEVIKPIVSGVTNGANKINLVLDKFSQMPLYYSMVQGTNLEKLYLKMMAEKKGYIIMISGRKVGAEALHDLYNKNGEFNDAAFNNNIEIPWKAYGIQVETAYEGSGMQTRGSQVTKISTLDLYDGGEPIGDTPQRKEEIAKEVARNRDILNRLHKNGYERFLKRLGIEDLSGSYKIVDKRRLAKTLQDEMFRRELSDNVKDSIQLDENGEFIIPFEASPAYLQIKSILYSFIDKEITSPKMNGGSYVQTPVTLWENAKAGRKIAIKTADGYKQITRQEFDGLSPEEQKKVVLTDDTLKFYEDEDGKRYCEVMLPHWFKSKLGKHANKSDEELIKFLNTTIEGKELLSGLGFRIPSQAYSSMDAFRVKAFLPQYMGKTVVVPSEITTKTGSDFDIDKLNMYLKSVYVDKNGEIRIIKLRGTEEATKDFYAKVFDEKLELQKINKAELFDAATIMVEGLDDPKNLGDRYADAIDILFAEANTLEEKRDVLDDIMKRLEKLGDKDAQALLKEKFVEDSYRRALENEYYDSLEKLVTMPENFQRLMSPVSDDGLKELSNVLDELRGYDENKIKNRLLDRNYMTALRHAFVTAKKWVGIAAVNITGHSLTQKFKAYIDPARFNSVSVEDRKILNYGGGEMVLDHNTIDDNGKSYISLSGRLDADGKFISDGLSGYATSFVDVAKDPYILKIIKSNLAVSTFMFLRRVGVPRRQLIMFMNQPIIDEYLTMLDNKGVKNLFDSRYMSEIKNKFPSRVAETASTLGFNKEELEANIKNYYATKDLGDAKNREQVAIFNEFLKYAKMAEYSFNFGQASNYDTTKFQSGDSLQLKQWRTETAQKKNIISSVGNLLENNFIGVQAEYLDMSMDAIGEALVLETPQFTDVTNEVLKSYEQDRFLSKDKFDRIANKIKAAFLDYIIQKRSDIATNLQEQLVDDRKSVAQMLLKAKQDFPGVQIIEDLEVDSSGRIGGAQTIKLKVNDKIAYNENMYAGMMRELRDDPRTNALYKGIVRLAIIQGTYQSPISIKNIIPVEDYSAHITPILAGLTVDEEIRAFATSNEFQRNEWQDNDVVPVIEPTFEALGQTDADMLNDLPRTFQGRFKTLTVINGQAITAPGFFPVVKELGANKKQRDLLFISAKYQGKVANYDVIKVPRTVPINKRDVTEGRIDVATGKEITARDYAKMAEKGDLSLRNYYGYQKVKYADGSPVIARYDKDGNPTYVYKLINLHGDGQYATEYYGDGRPSIFNNGSEKNVKNINGTLVSNEIPDQAIIDFYGGESVTQDLADPIIATIERESENLASTQPSTDVDYNKAVEEANTRKPIAQNFFDGYRPNSDTSKVHTIKPEITSKYGKGVKTITLVKDGVRTRSTRLANWMKENNPKVGDYFWQINEKNPEDKVLTRITAVYGKSDPRFKDNWNKEGWIDSDFKYVENYDSAIEFEVVTPAQPTPTTSLVEITKVNYTKETPNDKSKGFFFTENLQAYLANRGRGAEVKFDLAPSSVKLDVTASNNQAGIRQTNGVRNQNAFAIISKKYQQDGSGSFVKEEGQFQDTDSDFELFKKYNSEAMAEAMFSGVPLVISAGGIATGKSALPLRFAEWLNNELKNKLRIQGEIKKNNTPGYDGYGIFNLSSQSTQPTVNETKQELKLPEYTVDKTLKNADGSIRYASTDGGKIIINPVSDANKFFDYFEGKEGGPTSAQKAQVLSELAKQGYTIDVIKSMLNTNKLINTFLILHEQSHIDNNDKDVYWLNSKDLLTPDKIAIEVRATVDALEKLGGKPLQKPTSEVIYKDKAKRIRIDYPKTIQALNSKLDSSKLIEVSKLTNYTDVFEGDIIKYGKEVLNKYGAEAGRYAEITNSEITNEEGEFLKNNPEFATEFLEAFENDDLADGKTLAEYAQILLDQNEKLVDTAQLSLFDPNNEDLDGADEPNPCGII